MSELRPAPRGYPIKLVRDKTPEIINSTGVPGALWYAPLEEGQVEWLLKKLTEELGEYLIDGGWDELRDLLAVVDALAQQAHASTLPDLIEAMRADPRGGFERGVMMYGRHPEFDR